EDAGKVRDRALAIADHLAAEPKWGLTATKQWMNEIGGAGGGDGSDTDDWADRALATSLSLVGTLTLHPLPLTCLYSCDAYPPTERPL
ncbi:MAG: hypothetical protein ABJB33_07440, partial [Gemmatimonadota bacterium]